MTDAQDLQGHREQYAEEHLPGRAAIDADASMTSADTFRKLEYRIMIPGPELAQMMISTSRKNAISGLPNQLLVAMPSAFRMLLAAPKFGLKNQHAEESDYGGTDNEWHENHELNEFSARYFYVE